MRRRLQRDAVRLVHPNTTSPPPSVSVTHMMLSCTANAWTPVASRIGHMAICVKDEWHAPANERVIVAPEDLLKYDFPLSAMNGEHVHSSVESRLLVPWWTTEQARFVINRLRSTHAHTGRSPASGSPSRSRTLARITWSRSSMPRVSIAPTTSA